MNNAMNFGQAIEQMKQGKKVAREGWNGKGMFIFLADDIEFSTKADLSEYQNVDFEGKAAICMKTADNNFQMGWLASQNDILAEDWYVV